MAADGPGFSIWLAAHERNPGDKRDINRDKKRDRERYRKRAGGGKEEKEVQRLSHVLAQTK